MDQLYILDRREAEDACALVARFGESAAIEAELQASASRDRGNVIHYCRWRQIGRIAELLGVGEAPGTLH